MIKLNNKEVTFVTFPNNERRLDLNEDNLKEKNVITWKYENDSSIFELLLADNVMTQLNHTYNLVITYMPYSRMDADYYFKIDLEHGGILSEMEWLYKPKELVEHLSSLKDVTLSELFDGLVDQSSLDVWKWSRFDAEFFRASEIHPYEACLATARGNVNPDHKYIRIKDDYCLTTLVIFLTSVRLWRTIRHQTNFLISRLFGVV